MKLASFAPLFALLASAPAFAADGQSHFDYTFFGHSSGNYTMVSCDYASALAESWLAKFGAKDVELYCSGGIQPTGMITPLSIHATYAAPDLTRGTRQVAMKVESGPFDGDANCLFDTDLMRAMLRDFPSVKANRRQDACFDARSRYQYELVATLPQ